MNSMHSRSMESQSSCPLCGLEISGGSLREHVSSSHSKEDLLNALLDSHQHQTTQSQAQAQAQAQTQPMMQMLMLPLLLPQTESSPASNETPSNPMIYATSAESIPPPAPPPAPAPPPPQERIYQMGNSLHVLKDPQKKAAAVRTIDEFKKLLKTEEELIIVSSELAESEEFINFMISMNRGEIDKNRLSSSSSTTKKDKKELSSSLGPSSSPQPCSSRDVSQGGGYDEVRRLKEEAMEEEEEDDITLQDLVALETMEEDCIDEDQYFTLNSNNPLQPYVNSIIHQQQQEKREEQQKAKSSPSFDNFSCEKCGTKMNYFCELSEHLENNCMKHLELQKLEKNNRNNSSSKISAEKTSNTNEERPPKETYAQAPVSAGTSSVNQPALGTDGQHWKCSICLQVFLSGPQLLEHLSMIKSAPFKCSLCHLIFNSQRQVKDHKKNSHAPTTNTAAKEVFDPCPNHNGEYVCDKCDRVFKEKEMLIKHMDCHVEDKPFECSECGKKFSKITLLKCHYRRHFEVGNYECMICQKRFFTPSKLKEHIRVHTGETPLTCDVCHKNFKRHSNLSDHKRNVHGESTPKVPKELFCTCGKLFTTQRDLDWHYEAEHENKPKKCNYCGEVFVHNSILTRHIRLKHEENFIPTHRKSSLYAKCPICDQLFYKTSIPKHIRIKHHGQKLFNCDICKRSFTTKHSLVEHQWQHKGVTSRPFKCHLCPKAYLRPNLLEAHVNSHKGIKPYVCNECGTKFVTKSNWQRHVQEHSGSRNFECPRCLKKFSRAYYLTDHLKVHTGEKPYSCGICGKRTATRSNYNSHLRTHITRDPINSEV